MRLPQKIAEFLNKLYNCTLSIPLGDLEAVFQPPEMLEIERVIRDENRRRSAEGCFTIRYSYVCDLRMRTKNQSHR
jgi:hypothetical protein